MSTIEDRIYIGNVDFNATEDELRELFTGYPIKSVEIPTKTLVRGKKEVTRRLGFAFVLFDNKEAADKAVAEFNDKKFKDRLIFVKKAVPPPTEEEKQKRLEEYKAKKAARKEATKKPAENEETNTSAATPEASTDSTSVPKKKKKARKPKKKAAIVESETATTDSAEASTPETAATTPGSDQKVPDGIPSPDTIFITNLHYRAQHRTINSVFKEFKPKWVHVPLRPVPSHIRKSGKKALIFNKGIAFVKLPNHEVQQEAIAKFNGHEIMGRSIIVEVAIDNKKKEAEENGDAETTEETANGSAAAPSEATTSA